MGHGTGITSQSRVEGDTVIDCELSTIPQVITRRELTATVAVVAVAGMGRAAAAELRQVLGTAATVTGTSATTPRAVLFLRPTVAMVGEAKEEEEAVLIMALFQTMECAWVVAAAATTRIKSLREREWSCSHCEFLPLAGHWVLLGEEEVALLD